MVKHTQIATANELFKFVLPFCGAGGYRVNRAVVTVNAARNHYNTVWFWLKKEKRSTVMKLLIVMVTRFIFRQHLRMTFFIKLLWQKIFFSSNAWDNFAKSKVISKHKNNKPWKNLIGKVPASYDIYYTQWKPELPISMELIKNKTCSPINPSCWNFMYDWWMWYVFLH